MSDERTCCQHDEYLHEDTLEHKCLVCLGMTDEDGLLTPQAIAIIQEATATERPHL